MPVENNTAPVAQDDLFATRQALPLTISFADLLCNDSDPDGNSVLFESIVDAVGGTVTIGPYSVLFEPEPDFVGTASFQYQVSDGFGGFSTATATIEVAANNAPVAQGESYSLLPGQWLELDTWELTANDSDPDGDWVEFGGVVSAVGGTVTDYGSMLRFEPDPGFSGQATIEYQVRDAFGGTSTATVTIDVPANNPPVAVDDVVSPNMSWGHMVVDYQSLLANDTDPDGGTLRVSWVGNFQNCLGMDNYWDAVELIPSGSGPMSFDYEVVDEMGNRSMAHVTVDETGINHTPIANWDLIVVAEPTAGPVVITPAQLLANDSDEDGDAVSLTSVGYASNGTVEMGPDGNILFTPTPGFSGRASFMYDIVDARGASSMSMAWVDVPPEAAVSVATQLAATTEVELATNDTGAITGNLAALSGGGHVVTWSSDGTVFAQVVGADGGPQGQPVQVNTFANGFQYQPLAAALPDGGFVVGWYSYFQDGSMGGVYGQRFHADGTPNGTEFQITPDNGYNQTIDSLTALPGGELLVTYSSYMQDGSGWGVYGRILAADGTPGAEFQVNTPTSGFQWNSTAVALAEGGFVVQYWSEFATRFQIFNADGTAAGPDGLLVDVNTSVSIAAHGDGFIAAWTEEGGFNYVQKFDAGGSALGAKELVAQVGYGYGGIQALSLADGGYLLWWSEAEPNTGNYRDLVSQRFDANGVAVTDAALIHRTTGQDDWGATATQRADGSIVFSWVAWQDGVNHLTSAVMDQFTSYTGNAASNTIVGGAGDDLLAGGIRADTFVSGQGMDLIDNVGHGADGDRVLFGTGVGTDQLWFRRDGNSLTVSVVGTADGVTVKDWYASSGNHVSTFQTAEGSVLSDALVENLVQAMSSFAPPALGQTELTADQHQALDTVIAANWQHS